MRINTLKLKNFRRFEDASFEFGPRFNLLVGENGSGKSSVLEALLAAVCGFSNSAFEETRRDSFDHKMVRLKTLATGNSLRFEWQYPLVIKSSIYMNKKNVDQHLIIDQNSYNRNVNDPIEAAWTVIVNEARSKFGRVLPIFINFPSKRALKEFETKKPFDRNSENRITSRTDAYKKFRNASDTVEDIQNWFVDKTVERFENDVLLSDLTHPDELTFVNLALTKFVEGTLSFRYLNQHKALIIEWIDGSSTPFDILSDGQRGLIAMVADIARRACLLNPHLGTKVLEETPGIVLIDEIDLHLHPKWQRNIVKNLKKTFPKIQFIATTHSPQIIGECKTNDEDRVIRVTEQGGELVHNAYGKDSNAVLRSIMGANDRDPAVAGLLDELFTHIDAHEFEAARITLQTLRNEEAGNLYEIGEAEFALHQLENFKDEAAE